MKTEITADERLQLIGLLALGQQTMHDLNRIEQAMVALTGVVPDESGYSGHVGDTLYQSHDNDSAVQQADMLLRLLKLPVAHPAPTAPEVTEEAGV